MVHTIQEVAEIAGVHVVTAQRAARKGLLRAAKVGGEWRVSAGELERWRGLLTPPQAAAALRSNVDAILDAIHTGQLGAERIEGRWYIERAALAAWWRGLGGGELGD
jgi:excisionase family DNA binding protein